MKPTHNARIVLDGSGGIRFVEADAPPSPAGVAAVEADDYSGLLDAMPPASAEDASRRARGDLTGLVVPDPLHDPWGAARAKAAKARAAKAAKRGPVLPVKWDDLAFLHWPEEDANVGFIPATARSLWAQLTPEQRAEWRTEQPEAASEAEQETALVPGVPSAFRHIPSQPAWGVPPLHMDGRKGGGR